MKEMKPIPEKIALEICEEVREQNKKKKFSFAKGQFWGCMKYSLKKNDFRYCCIFGDENNRGCQLVNKIYDERY